MSHFLTYLETTRPIDRTRRPGSNKNRVQYRKPGPTIAGQNTVFLLKITIISIHISAVGKALTLASWDLNLSVSDKFPFLCTTFTAVRVRFLRPNGSNSKYLHFDHRWYVGCDSRDSHIRWVNPVWCKYYLVLERYFSNSKLLLTTLFSCIYYNGFATLPVIVIL